MTEVIPVVIIAGGTGSRIGGGKPERRLAGMTLLDHAMAKAARYSQTIAISVGADTQPPSGDHAVIRDEGDVGGPIAGLMAALKFAHGADAGHVMIIPCDTPFLPDDLFWRLHEAICDNGAAVARCAGHMHSACSLWRADVADLLPEYLAQGRRSLVGFAELAGHVPVDWPDSGANLFFNVNTADDLAHAETLFRAIRSTT